jgi:hypothetical protein
MVTSPNVEGTDDLTNSSRGSGTPPLLYHAGPNMAARAWPKPSPRQLEDSQKPSTSSRCFSFVSAILWWMDGCGVRRRKRQQIDNHLGQKGVANQARSGLGRSAQAVRPRPISAWFGPGFLPGCFLQDSWFVCTCMWAFDVVSFTVKAWILAMQASLFSGWVPEDLHIDASVLRSFGVMFIACLDSCRASWSSSKVLGELIPKVSSLA